VDFTIQNVEYCDFAIVLGYQIVTLCAITTRNYCGAFEILVKFLWLVK